MQRIAFLFLMILSLSCNKEGLLDSTDLDEITDQRVFSDAELTRRALYDLYGRMREVTSDNSGGFSRLMDMNVIVAMLDNASDDGAGNTTRNAGQVPGIQKWISGAITATSNPVVGTNPWRFYYMGIRNANIFLANIDQSPLKEADRISYAHQARFLRAYYYHELFRWFGPLVISTSPSNPFAFDTTQRASLKATVDFIVSEFDALVQGTGLPDAWTGADYGRATKTAAMAYKARTLVYAASPLFAQSGVKWEQAAQAAKDLIDYADSKNIHSLYVDDAEPKKSYTRFFNERSNPENILVFLRGPTNDLYNLFPAFNPWNVNKELGTVPTQSLVDAYDMVDGSEPITGYHADMSPIINPASGYDDQQPYLNRDPRFYQTILHHGMTWPNVNKGSQTVDIRTPQNWGSGYFLVKYLDDRIDHRSGGTTSMNFVMMRYAEVLLNYAEAINEAENGANARLMAVEQLNRIRTRAGITKPLKAQDFTQETLRERIRKERRVELCFEEHRFYDIRRWDIAKEVMNQPASGITISSGAFVRKQLDQRSYNPRMNLSPIPNGEVNNCPLVTQNPGY